MSLVTDQAICIRTTDYSETSQILSFFTREHGKIGAIAKGAKRAKSSFGGTIERFSYGPVLYLEAKRGGLHTLREFEPRHDVVAGLSRQVYAYYCSLFACELLNKLTHEHDPHPDLYDRYRDFLRHISRADNLGSDAGPGLTKKEALGLLIIFQTALLDEIGLRLQVEACANCQAPTPETFKHLYFSSQVSSVVCRDCEVSYPDRIALTVPVVQCLDQIQSLGQADEATIVAVEQLLITHFTNLLHQRPKTAKFLLLS